jgi:archaemetzincin
VLTCALLAAARLAIVVVPLGHVEREHVELAAGALVLQYGADVRIAPARWIPAEAYDRSSGRYVAMRLIAELKPAQPDESAGRVLMLGVTEEALVAPDKERVVGLAEATGGDAAVITSSSSVSVASLAIHEVGHLLGLNHHDDDPCAMSHHARVPFLCPRCAAEVLERSRLATDLGASPR